MEGNEISQHLKTLDLLKLVQHHGQDHIYPECPACNELKPQHQPACPLAERVAYYQGLVDAVAAAQAAAIAAREHPDTHEAEEWRHALQRDLEDSLGGSRIPWPLVVEIAVPAAIIAGLMWFIFWASKQG